MLALRGNDVQLQSRQLFVDDVDAVVERLNEAQDQS
jgi:hypothetical protein